MTSPFLLSALLACAPPPEPEPEPVWPDLLILTVETPVSWPNNGTLYERVLPPSPFVSVSIASLFSGLPPTGHGLLHPGLYPLAPDIPWLGDLEELNATHVGHSPRLLAEVERGFTTLSATTANEALEELPKTSHLLWVHLKTDDTAAWISAFSAARPKGEALIVSLPPSKVGDLTSVWMSSPEPHTSKEIGALVDVHATIVEPFHLPSAGVSLRSGGSTTARALLAGGPGFGPWAVHWTDEARFDARDGQVFKTPISLQNAGITSSCPTCIVTIPPITQPILGRPLHTIVSQWTTLGWWPLSPGEAQWGDGTSLKTATQQLSWAKAPIPGAWEPAIAALKESGVDTRWHQAARAAATGPESIAGTLAYGRSDAAAASEAAYSEYTRDHHKAATVWLTHTHPSDPQASGLRWLLTNTPPPTGVNPWYESYQASTLPATSAALAFTQLQTKYPASTVVWHQGALSAWERGDVVSAFAQLDRALGLEPLHIPIRRLAAQWAQEVSDHERVVRMLAPIALTDSTARRQVKNARAQREERAWHIVRRDRSGRFLPDEFDLPAPIEKPEDSPKDQPKGEQTSEKPAPATAEKPRKTPAPPPKEEPAKQPAPTQ